MELNIKLSNKIFKDLYYCFKKFIFLYSLLYILVNLGEWWFGWGFFIALFSFFYLGIPFISLVTKFLVKGELNFYYKVIPKLERSDFQFFLFSLILALFYVAPIVIYKIIETVI